MFRAAIILGLLLAAGTARATTVTLSPVKDNTIYSDGQTNSDGAGQYFFTGVNAFAAAPRRALIAFDIAGGVPANASIDSVVLTLNMSRTSSASEPVALRRVLADWGEGASVASGNEGSGAPALAGDATWLQRFFNTVAWTTPGGDLSATVSATRPVNAIGLYSWRSAIMRADVQSWLNSPATNFGWALVGNESVARTTKRFDSRQNLVVANRPQLLVYFHVNPTGVEDRAPALARLLPATPNPFGAVTTLGFELNAPQQIELTIYDATGREVRRVAAGYFDRGLHSVAWNGEDSAGARVTSGVYFARLRGAGEARNTQRIVLVR